MNKKRLAIPTLFFGVCAVAHADGYLVDNSQVGSRCLHITATPEQFISSVPTYYPKAGLDVTRHVWPDGEDYEIVITVHGEKLEYTVADTLASCNRIRSVLGN